MKRDSFTKLITPTPDSFRNQLVVSSVPSMQYIGKQIVLQLLLCLQPIYLIRKGKINSITVETSELKIVTKKIFSKQENKVNILVRRSGHGKPMIYVKNLYISLTYCWVI